MSEGIPEMPKSIEPEHLAKTPLLIFGNGPVIDTLSRNIPEKGGTADVNLWSQNMAKAASILFERGDIDSIFILGGKTGGTEFKSESDLIRQKLTGLHVPENIITIEEGSQDTIANLINLYTMLGSKNGESPTKFNILGAEYHTTRIQILMQLFQIPYEDVFSAESIVRWHAMDTKNTTLDQTIRHMTDVNDNVFLREYIGLSPSQSDRINSYFDKHKGTETKDFAFRKVWEDVLIRELLQYPESWLCRVSEVPDHEHRIQILTHAEQIFPGILKKYNLDVKKDSEKILENKLTQIKKNPLSKETIVEWMEAGIGGQWPHGDSHWPPEISQRFSALMEKGVK